MADQLVATAYCPGIEIVDGEPVVCGSPDRTVLLGSAEDHGYVTKSRCSTCGTVYVEVRATLPGVAFAEVAPEWRRLERARQERYRLKRRGPPSNDHAGRPRRPDRIIRRVTVELDTAPPPEQTSAKL